MPTTVSKVKECNTQKPFLQNDAKVHALLHELKHSSMGRFIKGAFKHQFGKKALQQYIRCELVLRVQQASGLWEKFYKLVPLKVWNCIFHVIDGKLKSLVNKAAKIQEESKLMSVVTLGLSTTHTMSSLLL